MTTKRRRVHFGIDYGTSNSKLVIRDFAAADDGRAHVALDDGSERFSSSVALVGNDILFGFRRTNRHRILDRATWYESLKMYVAGEIKHDERAYYHGPVFTLPSGLSSQDLAALTVWWLIGEASLAAKAIIRHRRMKCCSWMTIGIPMSFYTDTDLRRAFVAIARVGWSLFRARGLINARRLSIGQAQQYLRDAHADVMSDPISDEEARYWVRSEAEAALWWAFRSPQISDGPYAKIDIGAGTTNASVFRIVVGRSEGVEEGPAGKLKMAFFGASSTPIGMDAVDEALAHWQGSDPSKTMALRGREDGLLEDEGAQRACRPAFRAMHEALTAAWKQNWALIRHARFEKEAWARDSRLFLLGGGALYALQGSSFLRNRWTWGGVWQF